MNTTARFLAACFATAIVSVAQPGLTMDCAGNLECSEGAFCEFPIGECSGVGVCAPQPTNCEPVFDPVCGCDGVTYENACSAAASGVSVVFARECHIPLGCKTDANCPTGSFCEFEAGTCGGEGFCTVPPEGCSADYDPVCGCDGRSYSNACMAAAAETSVAYEGLCDLDDDLWPDFFDKCVDVANPLQEDFDVDSIGNACDPDVAPAVNDCVVNFHDLAVVRINFLAPGNLHTDFNSDGVTNMQDVAIMKQFFFGPPGPSGLPNDCDGP